ncbi:MAG: DUF3793 family protein [Lachnospiraceae bacterium]|nr:DUF3793 family protein [Lachnospiraceae bacterium]
MLEEKIIEFCSPTLAGIKTGNLFSIKTDGKHIKEEIKKLNRILIKKGLRLIPLREKSGITLIYLYRPERLKSELVSPETKSILAEKGYPCGNPDRCVVELIKRLVENDNFPHEIGVFLGYPPKDVRGFMNSPCDGVKCVGCWKVYDNQKKAEKTFEKYKICSLIYKEEISRGKTLESMIVDEQRFTNVKAANA